MADSLEKCLVLFEGAVSEVNRRIDQEKQQYLPQASVSSSAGSVPATAKKKNTWTPEEMNLLIKAVNLFPAGTVQRFVDFLNIEL